MAEQLSMEPADDLGGLLSMLAGEASGDFAQARRQVRMLGVVFARPNSPFAKSEILPQLADWHVRSGENISFYFAGYSKNATDNGGVEVAIPGMPSWFYNSSAFFQACEHLESKTSWRYSGATELILANLRPDEDRRGMRIDFSTSVCCQLDTMRSDQAISSVERFFESIFRFAESFQGDDPTWGFSDSQGVAITGTALKRVVLSLLPKALDSDYRKAEHFVVRDLVSPRSAA